jgi:2-oxo-4-hydroxy-4-carboxy--5-ureidoimidazoline (OHCU) decarboxylase
MTVDRSPATLTSPTVRSEGSAGADRTRKFDLTGFSALGRTVVEAFNLPIFAAVQAA